MLQKYVSVHVCVCVCECCVGIGVVFLYANWTRLKLDKC